MLKRLSIENFTLIDHLVLDFHPGMNVLTGETGAGKSILLQAISQTLGQKADPKYISPDKTTAEINAYYQISSDIVHIKRLLKKNGASKTYFNGEPVNIAALKALGEKLVCTHKQHQTMALFNPNAQREMLDSFAKNQALLAQTEQLALEHKHLKTELHTLEKQNSNPDRLALLQYQIEEFEEFGLQEGELDTLEAEHHKLSKSEQNLETLQNIKDWLCSEQTHNAEFALNQALVKLQSLSLETESLNALKNLLQSTSIHLTEAIQQAEFCLNETFADPEQFQVLDTRLQQLYKLARKHQVPAKDLYLHQEKLNAEYDLLENLDEKKNTLANHIETKKGEYQAIAEKLSKARNIAAKILSKSIEEKLKLVGMKKAKFNIAIETMNAANLTTLKSHGLNNISFQLSANPGLPFCELKEAASGGELTRISLAIQAITAEKAAHPTFIFDEVDTGVSGQTAARVGELIKAISSKVQVLCITHLPQVAAFADHHFKVEKKQGTNQTATIITHLSKTERQKEIARLLAGNETTSLALKQAKALIEELT